MLSIKIEEDKTEAKKKLAGGDRDFDKITADGERVTSSRLSLTVMPMRSARSEEVSPTPTGRKLRSSERRPRGHQDHG